MHTFKREEKRKYLVVIVFLKLNNTAISKRKRFSLYSCFMMNIILVVCYIDGFLNICIYIILSIIYIAHMEE